MKCFNSGLVLLNFSLWTSVLVKGKWQGIFRMYFSPLPHLLKMSLFCHWWEVPYELNPTSLEGLPRHFYHEFCVRTLLWVTWMAFAQAPLSVWICFLGPLLGEKAFSYHSNRSFSFECVCWCGWPASQHRQPQLSVLQAQTGWWL